MHPFSRGSVHIDPQSPLGKPIIDPKFLSNEYDLTALVEGAKFSRRIAETASIKATWEAETEPGPDVQTDEQWRAFAKKTMGSFYHPVGTCAMLPRKDGGVVDAELRVYGTTGLRVVDNSIIPIIPSAHIQTAAYGIAEVAAAKIIASA
ncbi:GMC oxidoreductase family protein Mala s like [Verticillium longisporum]|nr:GMC oxidoreductase family protein Mala s like [Verticillium longisporum]